MKPLLITLLFSISTLTSAAEAVKTVIKDPIVVGQAWGTGDSTVQFNARYEKKGRWLVKFDGTTFRKLTGRQALGFQIKQLVPSAKEQGSASVFIENQGQSYQFDTADNGNSWHQVGQVAANPKAENKSRSETGAVDLGALNANPQAATSDTKSAPATSHGSYHGTQSNAAPMFKILFDLLLHYRAGISPWTFDNYHGLLLIDFVPKPDIQFSFEVNPAPRYYEFDYQVSPSLQIRAGRIWIPFDDMNPHNTFGGFMNTSKMRAPTASTFLPDIWAELGVGMKYTLVDTSAMQVTSHLYIVNGFGAGGTDPLKQVTSYPNFAGSSTIDNNNDKAVGTRIHFNFAKTFGIGASIYTCNYTNQGEEAKRLYLLGIDSQLRLLSQTTFRFGYTYQKVELLPTAAKTSYLRGGLYVDGMQRFGRNYVFGLRAGVQQDDDRITDLNDQTWVGGRVGYETDIWQLYLIYMRDINGTPDKILREYEALRFVVTL